MNGAVFRIEQYPDRDSWLIGRTRGPDGTPSISASETAVLFDAGYKSLRALYEEKLHPEMFCDQETERMYWGRRLEPIIAEEITIRHGWALEDFGRFTVLRSVQWPFLTATLDRRIAPIDARGFGVAECKNSGFFMRDEWNENGAPLWVQIQGQSQLAVTGYSWGVFPVLLGGCEWRMVEFARDEGFIKLIVEKAAAFSLDVKNQKAPPADGSDSTTEAFKRRWNRDDGRAIVMPADAAKWDAAITWAQDAREKADDVEAANKNRLREAIGEATFGDIPDLKRRWSWKADKNGQRTLRTVKFPDKKNGDAA